MMTHTPVGDLSWQARQGCLLSHPAEHVNTRPAFCLYTQAYVSHWEAHNSLIDGQILFSLKSLMGPGGAYHIHSDNNCILWRPKWWKLASTQLYTYCVNHRYIDKMSQFYSDTRQSFLQTGNIAVYHFYYANSMFKWKIIEFVLIFFFGHFGCYTWLTGIGFVLSAWHSKWGSGIIIIRLYLWSCTSIAWLHSLQIHIHSYREDYEMDTFEILLHCDHTGLTGRPINKCTLSISLGPVVSLENRQMKAKKLGHIT